MAESESPGGVSDEPKALSVTVDNDGDAGTVVTVSGEIDLESCVDLRAALATLDGSGNVLLDLGDVSYIDSTGLRVLLTARDAAEKAGGSLRVATTSNIVARLIEITGADELLDH
jgi:anti-sigma B factor antagonist